MTDCSCIYSGVGTRLCIRLANECINSRLSHFLKVKSWTVSSARSCEFRLDDVSPEQTCMCVLVAIKQILNCIFS